MSKMTAKNFEKVINQLGSKPAKWEKYKKHNSPTRLSGRGGTRCRLCGTSRGVIVKYGLQTCRRCFRLNAKNLGFSKLN